MAGRGLGAIFWGAIGLLLLTIFASLLDDSQHSGSLRVGITSGIGCSLA
ncbi:hypothetical protein ACNKHP_12810 [Shigella boydii]